MSTERTVQRQHNLLEEILHALSAQGSQEERDRLAQQLQPLQQHQQLPSPEYQFQSAVGSGGHPSSTLGTIGSQYLGTSPPDPRLSNPRLINDYVDWYFNHYMDEGRILQWFDIEAVYHAEIDEEEEEKANIQMCDAATVSAAVPSSQQQQQPTPEKGDK